MDLSRLSPDEQAAVLACMKAAKDGPFFPDWEFQTLFGFTRDELGEMIAAWPDFSHLGSDAPAILASIVNMFALYPHQMEDELMKRTKCNIDDIDDLSDKILLECT